MDVEVVRALELALALIALVTLPCAIAAMICADEAIEACRSALRRRRERWSEQRVLGRLERSFLQPREPLPPAGTIMALAGASASPPQATQSGWLAIPAALRSGASGLLRALPGTRGAPPVDPARPAWPPIEQVIEDLRRLKADRVAIGQRREPWHVAVDHAYDVRLRDACRALGVVHHLDELSGIDREIERVRVEGELIEAGVRL